jgi:hypothetical protein
LVIDDANRPHLLLGPTACIDGRKQLMQKNWRLSANSPGKLVWEIPGIRLDHCRQRTAL